MNIWFVLAVAAVCVITVATVVLVMRHRDTKRREAFGAWTAAYTKARAGIADPRSTYSRYTVETLEAAISTLTRVPEPPFLSYREPNGASEWRDTIAQLRSRLEETRTINEEQERFAGLLAAVEQDTASSTVEKRYKMADDLYRQMPSYYSLRYHIEPQSYPFIATATEDYAKWLLEQAQSGDRQRFIDLVSLIRRWSNRSGSVYASHAGHDYGYPKDWNILVVRYFKSPVLSDFVGLRERGKGEVRIMAANALRDRSLLAAQIALAYCQSSTYRLEVGDVLTAELAKLVVTIHAEQNLTFA